MTDYIVLFRTKTVREDKLLLKRKPKTSKQFNSQKSNVLKNQNNYVKDMETKVLHENYQS